MLEHFTLDELEEQEHARNRERLAELRMLEDYDGMRLRRGYDYGNGQRAGELSRRRRELGELELELASPTPLELAEAWERIGPRRLRRAERDCHSYGTRSARLTLECWRAIERRYGRRERA